MNNTTELDGYIIAEGPEGLKKVLENLHEEAEKDAIFAGSEHYILYQLGNQRSLIRVDTAKKPYYFWYNDLLGRPATQMVKDIIANFLWEKFGENANKEDEGVGGHE